MILSAQSIPRSVVMPFVARAVHAETGMSYGLSCHGYDVRLAQTITLGRGDFALGSTVERFQMPTDMAARVCDKSTLARQGLSVFNTVIEAGWSGYLTIEMVNFGPRTLRLVEGQPIAQVLFMLLDLPTVQPYRGKYQDQPAEPVGARWEVPGRVGIGGASNANQRPSDGLTCNWLGKD